MPSCWMVLVRELAALARSAGAAVFAATRWLRYAPPPISAKRALAATASWASGFGLCRWVLRTTAFRVAVYAAQTFAFASPPCWGVDEALLRAGPKYARAARITASTAIASAAYVIHCNAFGCSLGEDSLWVSALASDLVRELSDIG